MAIDYLPSGGLSPYAEAHADTYGTPSIGGGGAAFDWSGVPYNVNGASCGWVTSGGYSEVDGDFHEYNIAIPGGSGRVAFTITTADVGDHEQIAFDFIIGDLQWHIREGYLHTDQYMTSLNTGPEDGSEYLNPYPWTGSCSYLLWFPSGIDEPARLDFDGGSIWMRMGNGFGSSSINIAPSWSSGGASTTFSGTWGGIGIPPPNDPKTAQCFVSGIYIESWDPTAGLPLGYPWAVAMDGGWHGTENLAATDAGWSLTYPVRLA
jgi:hypothetical protein